MTRSRRSIRGPLAAAAAALLAIGTAGTAHADSTSYSCQGADVPTGGLLSATMHGTLCLPATGTAGTVMVLVPGATYNHTYWDFPYQPDTYNFRQAMNRAGYATFVVDRLGTGASSRPLSTLVTSSSQAAAVHQVIQALRGGQIGGIPFGRVILGGHSLGSVISVLEAATYNDEDAVLLTGVSHHIVTGPLLTLFTNSFRPADLDPALAPNGYDPGYLTTQPGTRAADFYAPATTDPNVVATDEATKDVFSTTEAPDGLAAGLLLPSSLQIHSPVLLADGAQDGLFCDPTLGNCADAAALKASEAPDFSAAACLQTYVLPGSGHDMNLATDTVAYQQEVAAWAAKPC